LKSRGALVFGGETPQQNIFTGLFLNALSSAAALFSAIALYATHLGTGTTQWSVYVAGAFCLCIAGWQASSFVVGLKLRQRLKQGGDEAAGNRDLKSGTNLSLQDGNTSSVVPGQSVTEGTTRGLPQLKGPDRNTQP